MEPVFADDGIARFVAAASLGPPDVEAMREGVAARAAARARGPEVAVVRDLDAGGRPARLYRPDLTPTGPLLVWLHGGGWTIGTLDSTDRVARRLAVGSGAAVLVLDYRLAPEHPWPAAVDDAVETLSWTGGRPAALDLEPSAIGVGGDSAGGLVAALTALRLAREAPRRRPDLLALCYADADLGGSHASRTEKAVGFGLELEQVEFFRRQWVPDPELRDSPGVSPIVSADLALLPPTLAVTAEHDPLRDEGQAFAARVAAAGVSVTQRTEPGMVHNFLMLDELSPAAEEAGTRFARDVGRLLRAAAARVPPGRPAGPLSARRTPGRDAGRS